MRKKNTTLNREANEYSPVTNVVRRDPFRGHDLENSDIDDGSGSTAEMVTTREGGVFGDFEFRFNFGHVVNLLIM